VTNGGRFTERLRTRIERRSRSHNII